VYHIVWCGQWIVDICVQKKTGEHCQFHDSTRYLYSFKNIKKKLVVIYVFFSSSVMQTDVQPTTITPSSSAVQPPSQPPPQRMTNAAQKLFTKMQQIKGNCCFELKISFVSFFYQSNVHHSGFFFGQRVRKRRNSRERENSRRKSRLLQVLHRKEVCTTQQNFSLAWLCSLTKRDDSNR